VLVFFFFQAEDGIRDDLVTGVQTCALPIFFPGSACRHTRRTPRSLSERQDRDVRSLALRPAYVLATRLPQISGQRIRWARCSNRSEERRVGKECRARRSAWCCKKVRGEHEE